MSPPLRSSLALTALVLLAGCEHGTEAELAGPLASEVIDARAGGFMSAGDEVRWRIEATVATTPAPPPDGCLAYLTSVIEGRATHLGTFTGVGSTCIVAQLAPDPDPPFLPAGPPPYATAHFTNPLWTLTAANGDELWIESPEAIAVISLADGSLAAEGRQRIVGGTGRFAGATGEAIVGAVNEDGQGPDRFHGSGWMRFRAADRARR